MFSDLTTRIRIPFGLPRRPRPADVLALWRSRRALGRLGPAQLSDIGVSREAAEAEARRPPWDVPDSWRR